MVWVEYENRKMHLAHNIGKCANCGSYYIEFPFPSNCLKCNHKVTSIPAWRSYYFDFLLQKLGKNKNELSNKEYIELHNKANKLYDKREENMKKGALEMLKKR